MKFSSRSFPYPVLGNTDDVSGKFQVKIDYKVFKENIIFDLDFVLDNKTLLDLIKTDKASYVMHIECNSTFFRESHQFRNHKAKLGPISTNLLREDVDTSFFVCSNDKLPNYKIENSHPYFSTVKFKIENGDILAYGGSKRIFIIKDYDALKYVSSIMSIDEGDFEEGPMQVEFNSPKKINILLSKPDYKMYSGYKSNSNISGIFHSSIVLPVLMEALRIIRSDEIYKYGELLWYKILQKRLEDLNIADDDNNYLEISQKILDNPLSRSMKSIDYFTEELIQSEDE